MREFHISRQVRDRYDFDLSLYALSGDAIFANFHAARLFAQKLNQQRDLIRFPEQAVKSSHINAMGMIDEILHLVVALFQEQKNPQAMAQALDALNKKLSQNYVDRVMREFAAQFPPRAVYQGGQTPAAYLEDATDGAPNRLILLEEMLMLWLENSNPAFSPYLELFDDSELRQDAVYPQSMANLKTFFDTQPLFGPDFQNLIDMLRSPAVAAPNSLFGQLEYIRQRWGYLLGKYLYRILGSLDMIREEEKPVFPTDGKGFIPVPTYRRAEGDAENFSPDKDWMPRLVLIAKNIYVWLDQLSRKYSVDIRRLDQIPDQELDQLARWGYTGLWLIGVWERSRASQRIKQLCGNPEAVASAYSLFTYDIAADLGGEPAFEDLKRRAWQRGIRLASDMVPNHMGIDSPWVVEHPDWFVSLDYPPFPSYTFYGQNLSSDSRAGIYIEDHYYSRSDAAVVFKRVDYNTGREQFIYHGNDGTNMPWNDTAQLNYTRQDVREAVIQTILHVARQFPIIRFDAAMTLAKMHYQRLWFPEPGSGGDIPSRAEHSLSQDEFNALFPTEFWREVVDRVSREVPDTLLLAEAFWLMESYFVRTLGMHRVYNSAFMNLLRNEDNTRYRQLMRNTLEFDPEILKRYVNFMNNPDERTAIDQFGKGDKYFGICTLMATLPGLPMFGHGQIEGFTEKYGMEYRKAYWDESPDSCLVERHQREIFPLLHRRHLFSEVENFLLYDFYAHDGSVNEDVYAFSNSSDGEHSLVLYNNRFANAQGWINSSCGYYSKREKKSRQRALGDALGCKNLDGYFTTFRDHATGLEYIRRNTEIHGRGLYFDLNAYQYHVFLEFREIQDNAERAYARLTDYLNGRGVANIQNALQELILQAIQSPFRQVINTGFLDYLVDTRLTPLRPLLNQAALDEFSHKSDTLFKEVAAYLHRDARAATTALKERFRTKLVSIQKLTNFESEFQLQKTRKHKPALKYLLGPLARNRGPWYVLLAWLFLHEIGALVDGEQVIEQSRSLIDEWQLGKILIDAFQEGLSNEATARRSTAIVKILVSQQHGFQGCDSQGLAARLETWLGDSEIQNLIQVNRYQDVLWFNKERFEEFVWYIYAVDVIQAMSKPDAPKESVLAQVLSSHKLAVQLIAAMNASEYKVEKILALVHQADAA